MSVIRLSYKVHFGGAHPGYPLVTELPNLPFYQILPGNTYSHVKFFFSLTFNDLGTIFPHSMTHTNYLVGTTGGIVPYMKVNTGWQDQTSTAQTEDQHSTKSPNRTSRWASQGECFFLFRHYTTSSPL